MKLSVSANLLNIIYLYLINKALRTPDNNLCWNLIIYIYGSKVFFKNSTSLDILSINLLKAT
jgi:hypothetical protein